MPYYYYKIFKYIKKEKNNVFSTCPNVLRKLYPFGDLLTTVSGGGDTCL